MSDHNQTESVITIHRNAQSDLKEPPCLAKGNKRLKKYPLKTSD